MMDSLNKAIEKVDMLKNEGVTTLKELVEKLWTVKRYQRKYIR